MCLDDAQDVFKKPSVNRTQLTIDVLFTFTGLFDFWQRRTFKMTDFEYIYVLGEELRDTKPLLLPGHALTSGFEHKQDTAVT